MVEGRKGMKPHKNFGSEEFARAIVKVAISQICGARGFQAFHKSALEKLSDIAVRYIANVGKVAASSANSAGRTESNVFDIVHGLDDLSSVVGFSGASSTNHCLAHSGAVKEILDYIVDAEEIPFAFPLPPILVSKDRKRDLGYLEAGAETPDRHIPPWLPKFPDPRSNGDKGDDDLLPKPLNTDEKSIDPNDIIIIAEKGKKVMKRDHAPSNLLNGSACKGSGQSIDVKGRGGDKNPFLRFTVSSACVPSELGGDGFVWNHMDGGGRKVLDAFAPGVDVVGGLASECSEVQKDAVLNKRPVLQFKIRTIKKPFSKEILMGSSLDIEDDAG